MYGKKKGREKEKERKGKKFIFPSSCLVEKMENRVKKKEKRIWVKL